MKEERKREGEREREGKKEREEARQHTYRGGVRVYALGDRAASDTVSHRREH